ncbi:MAG: ComF family protein [Atopobiaceae bacterium]|nr:ComF family protein [Atopobiaceae bacterium]
MPGELLCDECRAALPWIEQRWACPVCGAPYGWLTCTECDRSRGHDETSELSASQPMTTWPTRASVCSLPFGGVGASLVANLKDAHELRLAPVMAALMACSLDEATSWPALDGQPRFDPSHTDVIAFVPATPVAVARRGFDHMELVSRALSGLVNVPLLDALARFDARDQRVLGKEERARNLAGTVQVVCDVHSLNVLLVDDVMTTGASMREAASALLRGGAASVSACALTRVC